MNEVNVLFNDAVKTFYLRRRIHVLRHRKEGMKEMFYLMTQSKHFIYGVGYMF